MNPTEAQTDLINTLRGLMKAHASEDYLADCDERSRYPYELWEQWKRIGLPGLALPAEYGGGGGDLLDMVLVNEELGRSGYDLAGAYSSPVFLAWNLLQWGTEEQKQRFLGQIAEGDLRMSVAMTEADAGSDVGAMRMHARREGDHYVLNGEKLFSSGAAVDDTVIATYARTARTGSPKSSLSCFLVANTAPGLQISPIRTLGRHMFPTTQLVFDEVRVPVADRLGDEGAGWAVLLSGLEYERVAVCAAYVGNAQRVVDDALRYAREREQFGQPIGEFQVIAHMLADMQTEVDAARLLTYRAAELLGTGESAFREVCMAKLFGSEMFFRVASNGVQIMGGLGYSMESSMQRHFRAARGATITGGTSQMQREQIARSMGLRTRRPRPDRPAPARPA